MTKPENAPSEPFEMRLAWRNTEGLSRPANQFIVSMSLPNAIGQSDAIHLTMGQADPPIVSGSPEQMEEQLRELGTIPVETLGRYALTRARLSELIQILQEAARTYDSLQQPGGPTDGDAHADTV
ncbi:hypothetical protein [Streptomyces sp. SM11]|uniref:hypothetical protein n=1 Tax=Streptomyces sp. SM11 TaxID=565557 RepID=UPI0011B04079|nr:hypothetical protein [Streptomyces sp. SM11]